MAARRTAIPTEAHMPCVRVLNRRQRILDSLYPFWTMDRRSHSLTASDTLENICFLNITKPRSAEIMPTARMNSASQKDPFRNILSREGTINFDQMRFEIDCQTLFDAPIC